MIKAKFSNKVKQEILERDNYLCIICECYQNFGFDCHHVYFGQQSNYGSNRNCTDQGVLLCRNCHGKAHSCKSGEGVRQKCINYLKKLCE